MERSRAGLTPAPPAVTPTGAVEALRASGRRVSAARRLVLEALFCADGPMSADQIADGIGGRVPRSDHNSVYRNLETLEEVGLVSHVHLGHGPGLYALNLDGEREWLTCERCGDFRAVDPARLDGVRAAIEAAFGYRASFAHFPVVGLCESCLSALGASIST
ncbi:MAG: Fur family transcriptional regulator [Solirubrobacteraceae bacterium]